MVQFEGLFYTSLQANKGKSPKTSVENWISFDGKYAARSHKHVAADISDIGTAASKNVGTGTGQIPDMSFFQSSSNHMITPDGTLPNGEQEWLLMVTLK